MYVPRFLVLAALIPMLLISVVNSGRSDDIGRIPIKESTESATDSVIWNGASLGTIIAGISISLVVLFVLAFVLRKSPATK